MLIYSNSSKDTWRSFLGIWSENASERNHLEVAGSIPTTGKNNNPIKVNRIGTVYPVVKKKGFSSRFSVDSQVQHETPEEGRSTYRPRCWE